ncbi:MAG: hypothetical protein IJV66_07005 [Firmicutes bacterium]|nr:hypothetical protein [Bacillota bacterium]
MGDGIIGKILYFRIFIIGALVFAKLLRFIDNDRQLIIFLIAVAVVYIVWTIMRELGKRKRAERDWEAGKGKPAPVHKGQSNKKKRR